MKLPIHHSAAARPRVLVYQVLNQQIDFTFEVWAYGQLPAQAVQHAYEAFLARQDTCEKRKSLAGCVIRHMTDHGLPRREQP